MAVLSVAVCCASAYISRADGRVGQSFGNVGESSVQFGLEGYEILSPIPLLVLGQISSRKTMVTNVLKLHLTSTLKHPYCKDLRQNKRKIYRILTYS